MGIKAKLLLMGIFSIVVAVCIGVLGINSINRNGRNSEIESIVNEMDNATGQKSRTGGAVSILY